METIDSVAQMRTAASRLKSGRGSLSLVPTMGALHPGHEALIAAARAQGGAVVVSLFVNPLAFGANENFSGYPRSLERDLALCERLGVDAVFAPPTQEIYPKGYSTFVAEESVSRPLCGLSRPTHFRGVVTLITKLINIVGPDRIVLGQKDVQHVAVIRKVTADLNYNVEVVVVPTVREQDGLAVSVRNHDLSATQRHEALAINTALSKAKEMVESGVRSTDRLVAEVTHILGHHNRVRVIYASVVDPSTMEAIREVEPGKALLCIAAWVDEIRLTDNVVL
jgi:pantoate--beta-alanine ligase